MRSLLFVPADGESKLDKAMVVNGTKRKLRPIPRTISGQKKSSGPEASVDSESIQVAIKNKAKPIEAMICGGNPFFSMVPINGIIIPVTKLPGSISQPV